MSKLGKINDLAFDLMNEVMDGRRQISYGKQIYDLSCEQEAPRLNEKQEYILRELVCQFDSFEEQPTPFQAINLLMLEGYRNRVLRKVIINLDKKQQAQVLRAFADWIEQEEAE